MITQEDVDELRRRALDETGLGRPVPNVTPAIALLIADLVTALQQLVDERNGDVG